MDVLCYRQALKPQSDLRQTINHAYRMDEKEAVRRLLEELDFSSRVENQIAAVAKQLVTSVRQNHAERNVIEAFMLQYDLSMEEGVLMMCLAEALLRVPDKETEQLLLQDKLTSAEWNKHIGNSESAFVNMATWGLALSGKILQSQSAPGTYFKSIWQKLLHRSGEPVIRKAVRQSMKILSKQFVIGQTINSALKSSANMVKEGYCFSYDMLGEAARTQPDADRYFQAYFDAITAIGKQAVPGDITKSPSISVKLSALHPRYEYGHRETVVPYLTEQLKKLVAHAKANQISLTIDAEEADRLEISLDIIEAIFCDPDFKNWEGLGLALQAYQRRAFYVIDWLVALSRRCKKRIQVRLVKGAYWDTEIKISQVEGFSNYPVFTRKANTDLSYVACAKKMLQANDAIYPQFATHNAYSVAAVLTLIGDDKQNYHFEFQSLQGMGRALHDEILDKNEFDVPCRIYAPVGSHEDLLPYLVRRLLENGANSSFVNRISDPETPIEQLIESPIAIIKSHETIFNPRIPLPSHIYGDSRLNAEGLDLSNVLTQQHLSEGFRQAAKKTWSASPFLRDVSNGQAIVNPANTDQTVGTVEEAGIDDVDKAMQTAQQAYVNWTRTPVEKRAEILERAADLLESHKSDLMYLAVHEAGKTLHDANAEVREAIDFCRYYASQAKTDLADKVLPGPTGEYNALRMRGRGVILCISPWNFPLAIFAGQVVAALVAGNAVVAKPAEQTPLIAALAVRLFYEAGLPENVLQLIPGQGETVGKALVEHQAVAGVMFTGSTETARAISLSLASRGGAIVPLIAETGGMNAMIADSTALPEQLVRDVLISAFGSAGQRCSALRLLYLQEDIADNVMTMLAGAMAELSVGNPLFLSTDVGPVIDEDARTMLLVHAERMEREARLIYRSELSTETQSGYFVAPQAFELSDLSLLKREVFGPMLHVFRYKASELNRVVNEINGLGYGLTFGIQSRINTTVQALQEQIQAGNIYVNRNIIGAVVGVQPFGGSRLSGTGPKAGGPHYLPRLCQETTLTVDTTAVGGNASLMAMED